MGTVGSGRGFRASLGATGPGTGGGTSEGLGGRAGATPSLAAQGHVSLLKLSLCRAASPALEPCAHRLLPQVSRGGQCRGPGWGSGGAPDPPDIGRTRGPAAGLGAATPAPGARGSCRRPPPGCLRCAPPEPRVSPSPSPLHGWTPPPSLISQVEGGGRLPLARQDPLCGAEVAGTPPWGDGGQRPWVWGGQGPGLRLRPVCASGGSRAHSGGAQGAHTSLDRPWDSPTEPLEGPGWGSGLQWPGLCGWVKPMPRGHLGQRVSRPPTSHTGRTLPRPPHTTPPPQPSLGSGPESLPPPLCTGSQPRAGFRQGWVPPLTLAPWAASGRAGLWACCSPGK